MRIMRFLYLPEAGGRAKFRLTCAASLQVCSCALFPQCGCRVTWRMPGLTQLAISPMLD